MTALAGALSWPLLVRVRVGPVSISPHGLGIAAGFLAGAALMVPAAERRGISRKDTYDMLAWAIVGTLVGARFFYVVNHLSEFESPLEWFAVWKGGISLLGGIFGAMVAAAPVWRRRRFRMFQVMDAAAPGLALGVIVGRLGDLVVGDHFGKTTSFFLGFRCPDPAVLGETVASPCPAGHVVHQAALYDLLLTIPLLVVLLWLRRKPRWEGFLFCVWLLVYGVNRLVEDFTRIDKRIIGLTGSQWTAVGMMILGVVLLARRRSPSGQPTPTEPLDPPRPRGARRAPELSNDSERILGEERPRDGPDV